MIVSRLAPSPTGSLHLGNVRTFLWAWASARKQNGRVIMRVEDLDQPRVKPGVIEKMLDDLRWLGFDWDEGPDAGGANGPYIQSQRRAFYLQIHERLYAPGAIYPCVCSRADIAAAQSAPHEGDAELRYPGTCRGRFSNDQEALSSSAKPPAWRVKVDTGSVEFNDLVFGARRIDVASSVGDFVIAKAPDNPAYQLAVVTDDIAMGVTEVVRGDDLIPSTARQILLYRLLGAQLPIYAHVPLVVGTDGKRLAKRHGDSRIASLRERGISPEHIVGVLARWSGFDVRGSISAREFAAIWNWEKVVRERIVLRPERLSELD